MGTAMQATCDEAQKSRAVRQSVAKFEKDLGYCKLHMKLKEEYG